MSETLEKIKNGTIRIERGKLIGLGNRNNESIDIEELNALIEFGNNSNCIDVLCKTITAVADILSSSREIEETEIKDYVEEWIIPALPDYRDVFTLRQMIAIFNT